MRKKYILAIDQGTTNTKAFIIDETGSIISRASRSLTQNYPQPAWVEQDPLMIWNSVCEAIDECLEAIVPADLIGIAITNQRESVMLWERATGRPLGPSITWQCRRTADFCRDLRSQGLEPLLRERTGLTIDPLFSGSKARWLLEHTKDGRRRAENGDLCIGTMDSWLLWNLTGGKVHACDCTNASRTQLLDIRRVEWDDELLDIFGVPSAALPEVKPSSAIYGHCVPIGNLPGGIPIASMIGDSHGAMFGHAKFQPGSVKATYGTGSSLMTLTAKIIRSERGISSTIAWARDQVLYALEGNISVTGAAVQWLGEILDLKNLGHEIEELASQVDDTGEVYFVPAFVGLGAPHWNDRARGLICGITRGTTTAHLARATLEAIAYQIRDVFDAMEEDCGSDLNVLMADGGASRNNLLMQLQADILGKPVLRNPSADLSALGATYLAGLAVELWNSENELESLVQPDDRFEPRLSSATREELYDGWRKALDRTMFEGKSDRL